MRHKKKINHLGRTTPHRKAMLSNMASSLIINKRITTTVAKAKELRKFVEPLITKAKKDTTHSRRIVFSYLQDKESVKALFNEVAEKAAERPGGYTRIIKTGNRLGDNAAMCMMELVDFNELLLGEKEEKKTKTRRSRRGGKVKKAETTEIEENAETEQVVEAEVVETENSEVKVAEVEEEKVEAKTGKDVVEEKTEKVEENVDEVKDEAEVVAEDSERDTDVKTEGITEEEPKIDQSESTDEEKEENNEDKKAKE